MTYEWRKQCIFNSVGSPASSRTLGECAIEISDARGTRPFLDGHNDAERSAVANCSRLFHSKTTWTGTSSNALLQNAAHPYLSSTS